MTYKIEVTETLSKIVEIEAKSEEEAKEIAQNMYNEQDIILDSGDFDNEVTFEIINENEK